MNDSVNLDAPPDRAGDIPAPASMAVLVLQDALEAIEIADPAVLASLPTVSVVMLAYQHGPYISQAIESVIAQKTEFPFELVIGEDCSPDGTRAIVEEYQRRYPHIIRIVTGPANVGMMRNHFRTIAQARGEFIAFCEADDWWCDNGKLQAQFDELKRDKRASVCFHGAAFFNQSQGKYLKTRQFADRRKKLPLDAVILGDGGLMHTASIFLRRNALPPMEDWLLNAPVGDYAIQIWAASRGDCVFLPQVMSVYRTAVPGSWHSRRRTLQDVWAARRGLIEMLLKLESRFGEPRARRAIRIQISRYMRNTFLEKKSCSISSLPEYERYMPYVRAGDRALMLIGGTAWGIAIASKILSTYLGTRRRIDRLL